MLDAACSESKPQPITITPAKLKIIIKFRFIFFSLLFIDFVVTEVRSLCSLLIIF